MTTLLAPVAALLHQTAAALHDPAVRDTVLMKQVPADRGWIDRITEIASALIAIALLTLTGAATVAAALHRAYASGWISATVASMLLLLLPVGLETRTVIALLCGPMVGIAVHLAALARLGP